MRDQKGPRHLPRLPRLPRLFPSGRTSHPYQLEPHTITRVASVAVVNENAEGDIYIYINVQIRSRGLQFDLQIYIYIRIRGTVFAGVAFASAISSAIVAPAKIRGYI